jgi:hypothetical protein
MENIALNEWLDKTEWVQKELNTFPVSSLGMHRADVMRLEIERLREMLAAAPTPAELLKTTNSVQISSSQVEAPADLVRDAEPVAYVTGVYGGHTTVAPIDAAQVLRVGVALYTAPPAPSVPPVRSTGQWESSRIADYNRGWNACREAMLAATPQQEPLSDERILSIGKRFLDRGY